MKEPWNPSLCMVITKILNFDVSEFCSSRLLTLSTVAIISKLISNFAFQSALADEDHPFKKYFLYNILQNLLVVAQRFGRLSAYKEVPLFNS